MSAPTAVSVDGLIRPADWRWSPARIAIAVAYVVATVSITLLFRPVLAPLTDTVWAEDGSTFLSFALERSTISALTTSYSGYLHLLPRVLAEPASVVPLKAAAEVLAGGATLVVSCASVLVFHASSGHIRSPWLRGGLAVLMALVPLSGTEALANVTNLHWYVTFTAFWVLLWRPRGWPGAVLAGAVLLAAVLTSPQAILLLPLALLRFLPPRTPEVVWPTLAYLSAVVIHVAVIVRVVNPGTGLVGAPLDQIAMGYLQRVVALVPVGHEASTLLWVRLGWWWPAVAALGVAGILGAAVASSGWPTRLVVLGATAYSMAFLFSATFWRGTAYALLWPLGEANGAVDRYQILPGLLLWSALALAIDRWTSSWRPAWRTGTVAVCVVLVAAIVGTNLRAITLRDGPSWNEEVATARVRCEHHDLDEVKIPIDPGMWEVAVDCSVVSDG